MKFHIVICVFVIIGCVSAEDQTLKEELKKQSKVCSAEHNISPEIVQNLRNGDVSQDDENIKCYINCFLHKIGFILDNGEVNNTIGKHLISLEMDPVEAEKHYNSCKNLKVAHDCQSSWELFKCFKARN